MIFFLQTVILHSCLFRVKKEIGLGRRSANRGTTGHSKPRTINPIVPPPPPQVQPPTPKTYFWVYLSTRCGYSSTCKPFPSPISPLFRSPSIRKQQKRKTKQKSRRETAVRLFLFFFFTFQKMNFVGGKRFGR